MSLGERLSMLRYQKRLTQDQVSAKLGIKRARYSSWENNNSEPDIEMIHKLAQFYKVSSDEILGIETANNPSHLYEDKKTWNYVARANELPEDRRKQVWEALEALVRHHEEKLKNDKD